jgi:mRNA interferase MazF
MIKFNNIKQFDIYWVDLDPTKGVETRKTRPCVILQNNLINQNSKSYILAPLLKGHLDWPFVVNISPSNVNNIDTKRHINLKQLRAVDISRISTKLGVIEEQHYKTIINTIKLIFDRLA